MKTQFTLPQAILGNARQVANYCAVEIAEVLLKRPEAKDIRAIEQALQGFEKIVLAQLGMKSKNISSKSALASTHQIANYCAAEIAEILVKYPEIKMIRAVAQALQAFEKTIRSQIFMKIAA